MTTGPVFRGYEYYSGMQRALDKKSPRKSISSTRAHELAVEHGLAWGCLVTQGGQTFRFNEVGGYLNDGKFWVWAYRLKKNGKPYMEPTRLDRWEKV